MTRKLKYLAYIAWIAVVPTFTAAHPGKSMVLECEMGNDRNPYDDSTLTEQIRIDLETKKAMQVWTVEGKLGRQIGRSVTFLMRES